MCTTYYEKYLDEKCVSPLIHSSYLVLQVWLRQGKATGKVQREKMGK